MATNQGPSGTHLCSAAGGPVSEERLEREEIAFFPACPFPLPHADHLHFLLQQRLGGSTHKNISYDPASGKLGGFLRESEEQAARLRGVLADFGEAAASWLSRALPRYAGAWQRDRVSFRPEEEATRRLRQTARNDLLHIDAFPSRPAQGRRILRLYVNVNPTDPRVWVTSASFAELLRRYGSAVGLPSAGESLAYRLGQNLLGIFDPARRRRTAYDSFMLRLHDFLKANEEFQERAARRFWHFPPGSAWLVFGDSLSHAVLRGRFALEHSFFIAPETLACPELAPASILERACGSSVARPAA